MQNGESLPIPPIRENISDYDTASLQRMGQLAYLLSNRPLDETTVSETIINYETSAQNVRDRWELYLHADKYVDIQELTLKALQVPANGSLLDLGTADGKYLHDITTSYSRADIQLIGLELVQAQLDNSEYWSRTNDNHYISSKDESSVQARMLTGSATDLGMIEDASVDAVTAMFMIYHLDAPSRIAMLRECSRVLKPDGKLAVTTSGFHNKQLHRKHEHEIAYYMSIWSDQHYTAPRSMNSDFMSESGFKELHTFSRIFRYEYHDTITLDTLASQDAYKKSLRSMFDQFHPLPPKKLFNAAVDTIMYSVEKAADQGRPMHETVQRQILICSQMPLSIKSLPAGFKRQYTHAKSEM